jgi:hypothetical protein
LKQVKLAVMGSPENLHPDSLLSKYPDGTGCYYGFLAIQARQQDGRQINVRQEQDGILRWQRWFGYVGGVKVTRGHYALIDAEVAAIRWMRDNLP